MSIVTITDDGGNELKQKYYPEHDYKLPVFFPMEELEKAKDVIEHIQNFECREDDVMLCTFPKTGTHWSYEMIMMILNKSAEPRKENKGETMIEVGKRATATMKSPRVLNTHVLPRFLPKDLKAKQIKTVLCLRNPKDTAVSFYNHMRGLKMYNYEGNWGDWVGPYLKGEFEYGSYPDYLNAWQDAIEGDLGYPIHLMFFEDLKRNGMEEINKLTKFLGVEINDDLKKDILHSCHFDQMAAVKNSSGEHKQFMHSGFNFFRKGEVGNWKNWFTVAQNEQFDVAWKAEIRDNSIFKFQYT